MIIINDREFILLSNFIKKNYGINLSKEKKSLVETRLNSELERNNFENFSEYIEYIVGDKTGDRLNDLVNKITTNYTYFMREQEHFFYLRKVVLPYLMRGVSDRDLRIWSAGCSSGEEPYTLAMVIADFLKDDRLSWDTKLLATDISSQVLKVANIGVYDKAQINNIPNEWKSKYFKSYNNEKSKVVDSIRKEVIFRRFNLMEEYYPFKRKFQVIFCRNVMIYFDNETKEEIVNKFYDHTEVGGYLFIGHSESISNLRTKYKYISPAIYRKI
ncbi:CheR family methyltransferase [Clostridium cellulovorans]|uniref:protein-glutamate O-methyltransferase n=1 Tax=Clostridium cellulovorans (strain ATCC 35296 / DSM 3052 / OCM 3 / 743B) TaxID=573061 RepID=D9SQQ0_CLOC7|nr:protein-glutamate O-methyltransferase CheR [Clostridium cellulovorans]ADL52256.1 MCP methyltransferase, CheR-type [Clostridium cellulovorans 743B]